MRISIGDIKDYIKCPLYYKFKHIDELPDAKTLEDFFREYLKLALYSFYFSIIEKKKKSVEGMFKRWEELWFGSEMRQLFPEDILKERSNEAVLLIGNFIKKYGSEMVTPIAVNFGYEAIFEGKENIHVTGEIDLIKILNDRTRKSETYICIFSMSKNYPDDFLVKNDLGISIGSYAFRSSFKVDDSPVVINLIRRTEDVGAVRGPNDFVRAEKIVRNVCAGIKHGVFYPIPNALNCHTCPYRTYCLNERSVNSRGDL